MKAFEVTALRADAWPCGLAWHRPAGEGMRNIEAGAGEPYDERSV